MHLVDIGGILYSKLWGQPMTRLSWIPLLERKVRGIKMKDVGLLLLAVALQFGGFIWVMWKEGISIIDLTHTPEYLVFALAIAVASIFFLRQTSHSDKERLDTFMEKHTKEHNELVTMIGRLIQELRADREERKRKEERNARITY